MTRKKKPAKPACATIGKDARIESFLKRVGVQFRFEPELLLTTISWSMNVRGDGEQVDEKNLAFIDRAIKDGDPLPSMIVAEVSKKLVGSDGRHRATQLQKNHIRCFPTYVVMNASEDELQEIADTANLKLNGKDVQGKALNLALNGVLSGRYTNARASRVFCVPEGSLSGALRTRETTEKLEEAEHDFKKRPLSQAHLLALSRIKDRRVGLIGLAGILADAPKMTSRSAEIAADKLRRADSDVAMTKILEEERRLNVRPTPPIQTKPIITQLRSAVTSLRHCCEGPKLRKATTTLRPSEKTSIAGEIRLAIELLSNVEKDI